MLKEIDLKHPAARACVTYICKNLRAEDRREVAATPFDDKSLEEGFLNQGDGLVVTKDHEPTALLWWMKTQKDTCFVAMLATSAWPSVGRAVTRLVMQKIIPKLRAQGMSQAFCIAEKNNHAARNWLERLGFVKYEEQAELLGMVGKNQEQFLLYTYRF